jgi:sister-chromatid-cohesion protein PDS5
MGWVASLEDRLLDFDDKVRMTVVKAVCDLVKVNLKWVPTHILRKVADRLRDKKVFVRKDTLQKLTEVYKIYCTKCIDGSVTLDKQFEWIPSKIVRCCYDKDCKDFKPQGMEIVFTEELFEADLSVEERAKHWIALFSNFDENDRKALQYILLQKQR